MFVSLFCWVGLIFFYLPFFLFMRNNIQGIYIVEAVVLLVLAINAFFTARSFAKKARDDEEKR